MPYYRTLIIIDLEKLEITTLAVLFVVLLSLHDGYSLSYGQPPDDCYRRI